MTPQFNNMKELTEYLEKIEKRIETLEDEKHQLQIKISTLKTPKTAIVSNSFWKRSFTVWGHFMTANFIVSAIGITIYFCVVAVLIGGLNRSTSNPKLIPTPETIYSAPTMTLPAWMIPVTTPTP